jgi:hypothetical protein
MDSSPTLQDFVLNLIYDPAARSAFELDPESELHAAGLGDVTAADVQQVIPLVVDSAPVAGLHGPVAIDDLTTGVANLDVAGAVSQLQAITAQVAVMPGQVVGDLNLGNTLGGVNATVLTVAGDDVIGGSVLSGNDLNLIGVGGVGSVGSVGAVTSAVPVDVGGLSAGNDPALHLDNTVVAPVEHTVTNLTPAVTQPLPGAEAGPVGILDSGIDTVVQLPSSISLDDVADLDANGVGGATSSVGSLIKPELGHDPVHDLGHTVTSVTDAGHDSVTGVLHGVTQPADEAGSSHDLLGGLHH